MPIRFKDSTVNPHGLHPKVINEFLVEAERAYREVGGYVVTITSICDGVHSNGSYHYLLGAADLRTKNIHTNEEKIKIRRLIDDRTSDDFDILLEHLGGTNEHLHGELDNRPLLENHVKSLQHQWLHGLPDGLRLP